ncbi:MAG: UxaA family hydrolase [Ignavibacteriaceae bacterium]
MKPQFLVHDKKDNVGVAVVDIKSGEKLTGSCLEDGSKVTIEAKDSIPLGHKVALTSFKEGDNITKYGVIIGHTTKAITPGQHVHVHNVKSNRW